MTFLQSYSGRISIKKGDFKAYNYRKGKIFRHQQEGENNLKLIFNFLKIPNFFFEKKKKLKLLTAEIGTWSLPLIYYQGNTNIINSSPFCR